MNKIQIEFFGRLSERIGKLIESELAEGGITIAQLRSHLAKRYQCEELLQSSIRPVINDEMVHEDSPISKGDQVAFLSPLSGG